MGIWPPNLVEELAYRRCVIFLGSGISATAKNDEGRSPQTWTNFIEKLLDSATFPPENKDFAKKMISQNNNLLALQVIHDSYDHGTYSRILKDEFLRQNYKASTVHEFIKDLDSKIVITTNFDKIYDELCNETTYTKVDYTEARTIVSTLRSPEYLIIKAHGCISKATETLIFTSSQYYEAQKNHNAFYKILEALFVTHTVLFLGYSLNDPDINLVLQFINNNMITSSSTPHYILTNSGTPQQVKNHWKKTYNIAPLEYGEDYSLLNETIEDLKEQVLSLRNARGIS